MELIKIVFIGKVELEEKAILVQGNESIAGENITFRK